MHFLCLLGKCTFDPVQKMAVQKMKRQIVWLGNNTGKLDHNLPNERENIRKIGIKTWKTLRKIRLQNRKRGM